MCNKHHQESQNLGKRLGCRKASTSSVLTLNTFTSNAACYGPRSNRLTEQNFEQVLHGQGTGHETNPTVGSDDDRAAVKKFARNVK